MLTIPRTAAATAFVGGVAADAAALAIGGAS